MSSLKEIKAAIEAAAAVGLPATIFMTFDTAARSMMGITPADFASQSTAFGAAYVGANCGIGPAELLHSVSKVLVDAKVPVIAKGNCGIPAYVDGANHYHGTPELMAAYAFLARNAGVTIIGGCCGTTTEVHVRAMRIALESVPRRPFRLIRKPLMPHWALPGRTCRHLTIRATRNSRPDDVAAVAVMAAEGV